MLETMLRLTTSSANSLKIQWAAGLSEDSVDSQAKG